MMMMQRSINDEITITGFLAAYKNKNIIYIPNPGNAGDSLIAFGTLQVFERAALNYEVGTLKKYHNKILFYGGGGNLVGLYENCKNFINDNKDSNEIILLPHTINGENELIKNLGDNIKIICREKMSYQYVCNLIENKNNVFLSKDMAFYIQGLESYKTRKGNGECNCFRTDREKTNISVEDNNIDLSLSLKQKNNTSDVNTIRSVSLSVFDHLSQYETVNTNRLHMAIAGSLIDRKVNLYPNSYWKNEAVYEYTMKNEFKNTCFI